MEQRIYHGSLTPRDVARELQAAFHHGNMRVQVVGDEDSAAVQVATASAQRSGGRTAITVQLQEVEDGVMVQIGEQSWLGIAASLGTTAVSVMFQPLRIIARGLTLSFPLGGDGVHGAVRLAPLSSMHCVVKCCSALELVPVASFATIRQ